MNKEQVIKHLIQHEIKPSIQRISIMKYVDNHRTHPSVDEIYNALSSTLPTLSRTTVYNVLKLLEAKRVIQMITIDDKKVLFDANTENHAHFICKSCHKIIDMDFPKAIEEKQRFTIDNNYIENTQLYYKGICNECLKQIKN